MDDQNTLFFNKKSVFQAQPGVLLSFFRFEAEIFSWLFCVDCRKEYVLLFLLDGF